MKTVLVFITVSQCLPLHLMLQNTHLQTGWLLSSFSVMATLERIFLVLLIAVTVFDFHLHSVSM